MPGRAATQTACARCGTSQQVRKRARHTACMNNDGVRPISVEQENDCPGLAAALLVAKGRQSQTFRILKCALGKLDAVWRRGHRHFWDKLITSITSLVYKWPPRVGGEGGSGSSGRIARGGRRRRGSAHVAEIYAGRVHGRGRCLARRGLPAVPGLRAPGAAARGAAAVNEPSVCRRGQNTSAGPPRCAA